MARTQSLISQYYKWPGLATAVEEEVKQSPLTVLEAMQGNHNEKWKGSMKSEMDSLRENGVYEIVDRPAGKKVVKSKWVFRVGRHTDFQLKNTTLSKLL